MNILHISDFHLSKSNQTDIHDHLIPGLISYLDSENIILDLILHTGDIIDKGGSSFGGIDKGIEYVLNEVINPLLSKLNLKKENIFFSPGNHDLDRTADLKSIDIGLSHSLSNQSAVNEFIKACRSGERSGIKKIQSFKNFETNFYKNTNLEKQISVFESCYIKELSGIKIGIACLNSSWRSYSENDQNQLLFGESQFLRARDFLSTCDYKIALSHHPLDWVKEFELDQNKDYIKDIFDIYLFGHVHSGFTEMITGSYGKCICSRASATFTEIRSDSRKHSNGFTLIQVSEQEIKMTYKRYKHPSKFVLNTDLGKEGYDTFIQSPNSITHIEKYASEIKTFIDEKFNQNLIKIDENINGLYSLKNVLVPLNLSLKEENQRKISIIKNPSSNNQDLITIEQILLDDKPTYIKGLDQSGKTTALLSIMDYVIKTNNYIPIYINFSQTDFRGHTPFEKIVNQTIRTYSLDNKTIIEKKFIFLIDDLQFNHVKKNSKFNQFRSKYSEHKFIHTLSIEDFKSNDLIDRDSSLIINILNLTRTQIYSLIKKWGILLNLPKLDTIELQKKISQQLVKINLPKTPFFVLILFFMLKEKNYSESFSKTNIIQWFVAILLKEDIATIDEIELRDSQHYLSNLAFEFFNNQGSEISIIHLEEFTITYLKSISSPYSATKYIQSFLSSNVLLNIDNKISFKLNCVYDYFLALYLIENNNELLYENDNYLELSNSIDYITGIQKDNKKLIKFLIKKTKSKLENSSPINDPKNLTGWIDSKKSSNKITFKLFTEILDLDLSELNSNGKNEMVELEIPEIHIPDSAFKRKESLNQDPDGQFVKSLGILLKGVNNSHLIKDEKFKTNTIKLLFHCNTILLKKSISRFSSIKDDFKSRINEIKDLFEGSEEKTIDRLKPDQLISMSQVIIPHAMINNIELNLNSYRLRPIFEILAKENNLNGYESVILCLLLFKTNSNQAIEYLSKTIEKNKQNGVIKEILSILILRFYAEFQLSRQKKSKLQSVITDFFVRHTGKRKTGKYLKNKSIKPLFELLDELEI